MKYFKVTLLVCVFALLTGCDDLPSIGGYKMFYLPSSNYKVGQVFAIYSKPKKVDIIHYTSLKPEDFLKSKSADFTKEETKKLKLHIKGIIEGEITAKLGVEASKYINVKYTNTRVVDAIHTKVYSRIKEDMDKDPEAKKLIKFLVAKKKVKLNVATSILTADIEVTIKDHINAGLDLDVPKLLDTLEVGFGPSAERNNTIVGKNLAIGFHVDPNIVELLLEEFR